MTGVETGADIWFSSGSASLKTGNGECVDEGVESGLAMEGTKAVSLGS